jgi:hypothetical protein
MPVNGFLVNNAVQKYNYESLENYNTPDFSTSSTYQVGDYVMYQGKLYKCTTAVTTAGAWDASKWTEVTLDSYVTTNTSQTITGLKTLTSTGYINLAGHGYLKPDSLAIMYNSTPTRYFSYDSNPANPTDAGGALVLVRDSSTALYKANSLSWHLNSESSYHELTYPSKSGTIAVTSDIKDSAILNIANEYNSSVTYAVGDKVIYNGQLYKCTTAITTAESWTSAHWTAIKIYNNYVDLDTSQTISGTKTFNGGTTFNNSALFNSGVSIANVAYMPNATFASSYVVMQTTIK